MQKNDSMWYIKVQVPEDIKMFVNEIDTHLRENIKNHNLLSSLDKTNYLTVKIPYRYNKFECTFINKHDDRILSCDIMKNDTLDIHIECVNIWKNERSCGLTWKSSLIKKM